MFHEISIMEEEKLMSFGFSKNEARIYLALLKLGTSPLSDVVRETGIHKTNVFHCMNKLITKGYVKYSLKGKIKVFEAASPEIIQTFIDEKQRQLTKMLPTLLGFYSTTKKKTDMQVQQGLKALKHSMNDLLQYKKPIYTIGSPKRAIELAKASLEDFHKKRIRMKIPMHHIYDKDAVSRVKQLNKMEYTKARYSTKKTNNPFSINICGDVVLLKVWRKNGFVIKIKNKDVADGYRAHFDMMWDLAKN